MSAFNTTLIPMKQSSMLATTHERALQHPVVQAVYPIFPNDRIHNQIVQKYVDLDSGSRGKYRSRAISGHPIYAYVQTDKECWLVSIIRSVQVEYPTCEFTDSSFFKRADDVMAGHYSRKYEGTCFGCRVHHVDFDELLKQATNEDRKALRHTESRDLMVFPMIGKKVCFKDGFRIQGMKDGMWHLRALDFFKTRYITRVKDVFTSDILAKLWDVYATIEKDPELYAKYLKGEIVGEPADHKHPIVEFHMTVYECEGEDDFFSASYGGWGHIPGVLPVDTNGNVYHRETRIEIPPPPNGERIAYKSERALLQRQSQENVALTHT